MDTAGATASATRDDAEQHPELPAEDRLLPAGAIVGEHCVEVLLGQGSFGAVYRATHRVLGRTDAIKVLHLRRSEQEYALRRFVAEARMVAGLRHPNVVDVRAFGTLDDGRQYQVMELVDGPTLAELIRGQAPMSLGEAVPILRGIAVALDAVHAAGIVHRDLKPANVVLERREAALVPKLIDFGIAKLLDPAPSAQASATGGFVGTPQYMAPEQCRGRRVDGKVDVYAFGLLAYELLTGAPPFHAEDALDWMLKHTSERPLAPSSRTPALGREVDAVLLPLLEKDPKARPELLTPVVARLEAIAGRGDSPRTSRLTVGGTALVVLVGVGLAIGASREGADSSPSLAVSSPPAAHEAGKLPSAIAPTSEASGVPTAAVTQPHPRVERSAVVRARLPAHVATAPSATAIPVAPGLDDVESPYQERP